MSAVAARVVSAVVTLHARVWIEILYFNYMPEMDEVTLHARVWIEIYFDYTIVRVNCVTLHVRVWIEISGRLTSACPGRRHPPCEGVD